MILHNLIVQPAPSTKLVFLNGPTRSLFSFIFGLFKQTVQFLQQINVKNDHPIYGAGIWTHNLPNMSRHP